MKHIRKYMACIAALLLNACDSAPEACRDAIEARLVAPATVKYLKTEAMASSGTLASERSYAITIDASNRMGTSNNQLFIDGEVNFAAGAASGP